MKRFFLLVGMVSLLDVFGLAHAGEINYDQASPLVDSYEATFAERTDAVAGVTEYRFKAGSIRIDDTNNNIRIATPANGVHFISLDDAALGLANNNVSVAAQYRLEMRQSLREDNRVADRLADINGNGRMDDGQTVLACSTCTPFYMSERTYGGYATRYSSKDPTPTPPSREERAVACDKISDWDLDFAIDLAEASLACGLAETPPTFALCGVVVGKAVKNQKSRHSAELVCRDPRPSR